MAWLYKRKGSAKYWIGWRANGKQFLESTGESDKKKAEAKLRTHEFIENAKRDGRLNEKFIESFLGVAVVPKTSLRSAMASWLDECKGSTAHATWTKYSSIADEFCEFLKADSESPLLRDVASDSIRAFLAKKRATVTASTANVYRTILSIFFISEMKNERIRNNPVMPVRTFKENKDEGLNRRAFTLDEIKSIYGNAPNDFWRYMILGGFYTGLRLGDLVTMPWGAVNFEENKIMILTRKTKKTVHIPIAKPLAAVLRTLRGNGKQPPSQPIWPKEAEIYEKQKAQKFSNEFYELILLPAGLAAKRSHQKEKNGRAAKRDYSAVSFHSLRHSNITFLKSTGSNSEVAKALVGHSSDQINNLYTHLPIETLANAVNQLPEVTG